MTQTHEEEEHHEEYMPTLHQNMRSAFRALERVITGELGFSPTRDYYGLYDIVVWMLNASLPDTFLAVVDEDRCCIYYRGTDEEMRWFRYYAQAWPRHKQHYFLWLGIELCTCDYTTAQAYLIEKRRKAGQ